MTETITPLWDGEAESIDLSGFDANAKAALIPKGKYAAYCDECELTESNGGEAMVKFTFKIQDDEQAEFSGRIQRQYCLLTRDFGIAQLKRTGVALNAELNWASFKPADVAEYFEGKECVLEIIQKKRKDNGEMGNEIKAVLPAQGGDFWSN
jgi:hypothetical protein